MKKSFLFVLIFAVIIVFGFTAYNKLNPVNKADAESIKQVALKDFKEKTQKINNKKATYIIEINGTKYTNKEFEKFKARRDLAQIEDNKPALSEKQAKHEFIKRKALLDEAKKNKLYTTKEEASEYANHVREILENSTKPGDQQVREEIKNFREALGLTEDQYWNDYAIPMYQEDLTIVKLKKSFFNSMKWKHQPYNTVLKEWENYTEKKATTASVKELQ